MPNTRHCPVCGAFVGLLRPCRNCGILYDENDLPLRNQSWSPSCSAIVIGGFFAFMGFFGVLDSCSGGTSGNEAVQAWAMFLVGIVFFAVGYWREMY
jgi:hypothetical protein